MSFSGSGDKASVNIVKDEIDELIKDHKVMVFSKTTCMLDIYFLGYQ